MTDRKPRDTGRREYSKSGLTTAKRALKEWGDRAIDRRTRLAQNLEAWRDELIQDLGGDDQVSAMQHTMIDQAAKTRILLNGIDAWLFQQLQEKGPAALINQRDRKAYRILRDRQVLTDSLMKTMTALGLERRQPTVDLKEYLAGEYGLPEGGEGADT